jgi:hypothetical protein
VPRPKIFESPFKPHRQVVLPKLGREKRHAVFTRGPRELQGALQTAQHPGPAYPPPPVGFTGSRPEWAILWAHQTLGLREGLDFSYQSAALGGRAAFGGQVVDFQEFRQPLAINVQGTYWHYGQGSDKVMQDQQGRYDLARFGLRLIFIDEDDALQAPVYFLQEALNGIDHSRGARV